MSVGNFVQAVLSVPIAANGVVITLAPVIAPYSLPPVDGGTLILADSVGRPSAYEIVTYTARSGMNLTGVQRAQEGTTALAWPVGTYAYQSLTTAMYGAKVDKIAGKDLSEANFTTVEKTKLGTVADNATANANTDSLSEGANNKYFTVARVLASVLNGLATTANLPVLSTDSLLSGIGKLQAQINNIILGLTFKAASGANSDITSLSGLTSALSQAQGGTGRIDGKAIFSEMKINGPSSLYQTAGLHFGWGTVNSDGQFIVNKGPNGGGGGFSFRTVNADGSVAGPTLLYSAEGVLTVNSLNLTNGLPITSGGTGGTSQATAQAALGLVPSTSKMPTTVGQLLRVGDYGIGGDAPLYSGSIDNLSQVPKGKVYVTANGTGTKPVGGAVQGFLETTGYNLDGYHQIWTDVTGAAGVNMKSFQRDIYGTNGWSPWQEIAGDKVKKTGDTMTGPLLVPSLEVGSSGSAYIDFHSSTSATDYDARIYSSGGNTAAGNGALTYAARLGHYFDSLITGTITTAQSLSGSIRSDQVAGLDAALGNKMPAGGGNTYAALAGVRFNNVPFNLGAQGVSIGWNESGDGSASFVNNQGNGAGGFRFRNVNSANTVQTGDVWFQQDGSIYSSGTRITLRDNGTLWQDGNVSGTTWGGYLSSWINANFMTYGSLLGQLAAQSAAGGVGTYAMMGNVSGSNIGWGGRLAGTGLRVADAGTAPGGSPTGSWMSMGLGLNGGISLWLRYA